MPENSLLTYKVAIPLLLRKVTMRKQPKFTAKATVTSLSTTFLTAKGARRFTKSYRNMAHGHSIPCLSLS